jgi:TolB protein
VDPAWSPDGRWLAVEVKRGEHVQVAVLPAQGGPLRQLTAERGQSWPETWAPDSDRIVFAGEREGVWNIYSVSCSTGEQRQLTHLASTNGWVRYPAWSPAGDRILFERTAFTANVWTTRLP